MRLNRYSCCVSLLLFAGSLPAQSSAPQFGSATLPVLERLNCRACHVENGVASATRFHFPERGASPAAIEAFGRGLSVLVNRAEPEKSLLIEKPTGRVKHTGGKLIAPGSDDEKVLIEWARVVSTLPQVAAGEAAKAAPPVRVRRLTHSQYNHTVRDLLGDLSNPANQFPPEDFVNGFKNQTDAQSLPTLLAEAYGAAAERLAKNAFRGGDGNKLVPCQPRGARDASCADAFVKRFGQRAFRRPLSDSERNRYSSILRKQADASKDFYAGAQLVVEAMLQSPNFLFRVEPQASSERRNWETASQLSYFLWDTMPDGNLFDLAASGRLSDDAAIANQARRMLDDPKARDGVDEFVAQWLRFDRVLSAVKDRRAYPQFTPELAFAMTEEVRRLVGDFVWGGGNFMELFNARHSFVNSDLAALYKVPAPEREFDKVSFPADSGRAGLLGLGAFLTLTSKPGETSPTARGLFVREQFLCQHVPDPPPGTNANLPPVTAEKPMTNRERLGVHMTRESCSGCHRLIDPIGFGLEKFDGVGAFREKQKLEILPPRKAKKQDPVKLELEINTQGEIAGIPDSQFSSPREIGDVLARSPQCQECVVKQLWRYASGRHESAGDRAAIRRSFDRFRDSQFRFRELMIAIATENASAN